MLPFCLLTPDILVEVYDFLHPKEIMSLDSAFIAPELRSIVEPMLRESRQKVRFEGQVKSHFKDWDIDDYEWNYNTQNEETIPGEG